MPTTRRQTLQAISLAAIARTQSLVKIHIVVDQETAVAEIEDNPTTATSSRFFP